MRKSALYLALACAFGATMAPQAAQADAARQIAPPTAASRDDALRDAAQYREARRWPEALAIYETQLAARPDDGEIYRLRTLTLADLGNAERAWVLYRAHPGLFSQAERERLETDRLARLVVWGGLYTQDPALRTAEMARAQGALRGQLATLPPGPAAHRVRIDALVALNGLCLHAEAVAGYRSLQAEGIAIPPYAAAKVADSLLAVEAPPEEAVALLETVAAADPGAVEPRVQLAYAYADAEHYDRAIPLLESLVAGQAPWPRVEGAPSGYQNWPRYDAEVGLAMVRSFGEDLAGAQADLEALLAVAPNNADLQAKLGSVYLRRGWPERALERYRVAQTLDERNVEARIGQAEALLDLDRVDQARPIHADLIAQHARDPQVQRLDQRWQRRQGWQVEWTSVYGDSRNRDGDATSVSPLGSRDAVNTLVVEGPLLNDRWRLTASAGDRWADFQGEHVHDTRAGVGAIYAHGPLRLDFDLSRSVDDFSEDTSFGLAARWRFGDTLQGYAAARSHDPEASLQARASGITADSAALGLSWTPSELGRLDVGVQQLRYDDGNRREALGVDGERRLLTRPHFQLTGLAGVYASRGSEDDAPYFNPSEDRSWQLGLRADHLAWRRYQRQFRQTLEVGFGQYWQEGFGSEWVPQAAYRHEWRFDGGQVLGYGVTWARPVYDGARENRVALELSLRWGE